MDAGGVSLASLATRSGRRRTIAPPTATMDDELAQLRGANNGDAAPASLFGTSSIAAAGFGLGGGTGRKAGFGLGLHPLPMTNPGGDDASAHTAGAPAVGFGFGAPATSANQGGGSLFGSLNVSFSASNANTNDDTFLQSAQYGNGRHNGGATAQPQPAQDSSTFLFDGGGGSSLFGSSLVGTTAASGGNSNNHRGFGVSAGVSAAPQAGASTTASSISISSGMGTGRRRGFGLGAAIGSVDSATEGIATTNAGDSATIGSARGNSVSARMGPQLGAGTGLRPLPPAGSPFLDDENNSGTVTDRANTDFGTSDDVRQGHGIYPALPAPVVPSAAKGVGAAAAAAAQVRLGVTFAAHNSYASPPQYPSTSSIEGDSHHSVSGPSKSSNSANLPDGFGEDAAAAVSSGGDGGSLNLSQLVPEASAAQSTTAAAAAASSSRRQVRFGLASPLTAPHGSRHSGGAPFDASVAAADVTTGNSSSAADHHHPDVMADGGARATPGRGRSAGFGLGLTPSSAATARTGFGMNSSRVGGGVGGFGASLCGGGLGLGLGQSRLTAHAGRTPFHPGNNSFAGYRSGETPAAVSSGGRRRFGSSSRKERDYVIGGRRIVIEGPGTPGSAATQPYAESAAAGSGIEGESSTLRQRSSFTSRRGTLSFSTSSLNNSSSRGDASTDDESTASQLRFSASGSGRLTSGTGPQLVAPSDGVTAADNDHDAAAGGGRSIYRQPVRLRQRGWCARLCGYLFSS